MILGPRFYPVINVRMLLVFPLFSTTEMLKFLLIWHILELCPQFFMLDSRSATCLSETQGSTFTVSKWIVAHCWNDRPIDISYAVEMIQISCVWEMMIILWGKDDVFCQLGLGKTNMLSEFTVKAHIKVFEIYFWDQQWIDYI